MSLLDDSGRDSCAPGDCTLHTNRMAPMVAATHVARPRGLSTPIAMVEAPSSLSSATRNHVLRLDRLRLVPPAGALVAEDRRHLLVGELVGECGHGGGVCDAADTLARQPMQHGADVLGRV